MKIKYFLFSLSISISSATFSSCEDPIGEQVVSQVEPLLSPECIKPNTTQELDSALRTPKDKANSDARRKKICQPCIEKSILKKPDEVAIQIRFTKQIITEAKKNLSKTMLDLMSVRAFEMPMDPSEAVQSCNFNKYEEQINSCMNQGKIPTEVKAEILNGLKLMKEQTRLELYNLSQILDQKPGSLLPREERACSITDKEILLMNTSFIEEELFKNLDKFKSFNSTDATFTTDIIKALDNTQLSFSELSEHPIIKKYLSNPASFKSFLNSANKSTNVHAFRNEIYKEENGKEFAKDISNRCKATFETMKSSFCTTEFSTGNLFFDDADTIRATNKFKIDNLPAKHDEKNQALLYFCQEFINSNDRTIKVSEIQKLINPELNDRFSAYEDYSSSLFTRKLGSQATEICAIENEKKDCSVPSYYCSLHSQWKQKVTTSPKLGSDTDKQNDAVNKILRSLLGNPDRKEFSDPKMITLLEREGIIKTESGAYTTNLPVPRSENTSTTFQAANTSGVPTETTNAKNTAQSSPKLKQQAAPTQVSAGYSSGSTTTAPVVASADPEYESEQAIRNDLQKKILDRLDNQISAKQIEDMVAKAYNKGRSNPLTPQQVTEKTKEVFEEMPNEMPTMSSGSSSASSGQASVSRDKEKEKKAQQQLGFLKAKYGIDPTGSAKGVAGKANQGLDEQLKVVAVDSPQDIKIVVDDIKNLKGQEIKKLILSEKPFILKVGETAYKINFKKTERNRQPAEVRVVVTPKQKSIEAYFTNLMSTSQPKPGSETYSNLKEAVKTSQR
jgi:hypothetical protein